MKKKTPLFLRTLMQAGRILRQSASGVLRLLGSIDAPRGSRRFLPLYVLGFFVFLAALLTVFRPAAEKYAAPAPQIAVETAVVSPRDFRVDIKSFGTVRPRTRSTISAQVGGEVISIHSSFREGGFFEKGEILLEIDPRNYEAARTKAGADLALARQQLAEEQAMGAQARADWQRMGERAQAPDLVLRRPQLATAEARVETALAFLRQAERDLEKTRVRAPYVGRVLKKQADISHVVAAGTPLAEIYAVDYVEIRLPLRNSELPFINLPENYRLGNSVQGTLPSVSIRSSLAPGHQWQGRIVRTEGAIDEASRQLHVVAQVDDPYAPNAQGRPPLKIGEYVTATIAGRVLADALVIPSKTIYQGSYVYIVENSFLQRREVDIAWQDGTSALVRTGLKGGDLLVLNPLGRVSSGISVRIIGGAGAGRLGGDTGGAVGEQL